MEIKKKKKIEQGKGEQPGRGWWLAKSDQFTQEKGSQKQDYKGGFVGLTCGGLNRDFRCSERFKPKKAFQAEATYPKSRSLEC